MKLTRRDFLGRGVAAGAWVAAGNTFAQELSKTLPQDTPRPIIHPGSDRPNILYIIMEDTGPQFSCYGEPLVRTPRLDKLAEQAIRFTNVFCTAPVCSPSRSALMTGCYQTAIGAHQHRTWPWNKRQLPPPVRHICDWFRSEGYFTCNLQPVPDAREKFTARERLNGPKGSGKIDLNFLVSSPKSGDPFDGIDWNQRIPGQPFFAHLTIAETHKGEGWKVARERG